MSILHMRRSSAAIIGLVVIVAAGCAVDGVGYGGAGYAYGADYYEPYGVDYGGWGDGYFVGPYREGGGYRGGFGGGRSGGHAYRSAPASHGMPSIPSGARGGGGGAHAGGGRR